MPTKVKNFFNLKPGIELIATSNLVIGSFTDQAI